jgi:flavodoxin
MPRILVVYYSRTGYTRTLARELVAALHADVDQLDDARDRCGVLGYLRCAHEALKKRTVQLRPPAYDPSHYDVVVLGTPVWAANMSSPLRSYVAAHRAQLKQVAFFCTQGSSGAEKVFRDLAELCGKTPLATLAVTDRELNSRAYAQRLEPFAAIVNATAGAPRSFANASSAEPSITDAARAPLAHRAP